MCIYASVSVLASRTVAYVEAPVAGSDFLSPTLRRDSFEIVAA